MPRDPEQQGRLVAGVYASVAFRLFRDIVEAGVLPAGDAAATERARAEWGCFALYACVRGLVAGSGFHRETALALDTLHAQVLAASIEATPVDGAPPPDLVAARYAEYGSIGRASGAAKAIEVERRLGAAAARHMAAPAQASPELIEVVTAMHEALVEGVVQAVREDQGG